MTAPVMKPNDEMKLSELDDILRHKRLRDEFAMAVIQGICSSGPDRNWSNDRLARESYAIADAMMAERDR